MVSFEMAIMTARNKEQVFRAYEVYPSELKEEKRIELMAQKTGMSEIMIKNMIEARRNAIMHRHILEGLGIAVR